MNMYVRITKQCTFMRFSKLILQITRPFGLHDHCSCKTVLNKEESSLELFLTNRPSAIHLAVLILSREPMALILKFCR